MEGTIQARRLSLAVMAFFLALAPIARAQEGYPPPVDKYVNDYAGVLDLIAEDALRDDLSRLDNQTGIEMTVLTVDSIYDYGTGDPTIESFATNLFNTWGIGDRTRNDGILILVAVRDRPAMPPWSDNGPPVPGLARAL